MATVELIAVEGSDHFWIGAPDLAAIFDASLAFARRVTRTRCAVCDAPTQRYERAGMTSSANMRIDRWVSSLLMPG